MVSSIMKKVASQAKQQDAQRKESEAFKPHRSELLKGLPNLERWLREQVQTHKKDKSNSAETKARYTQVAMTLDATRPRPGEPVQIEKQAKTKNTFYAYRAAVRWTALERAAAALRAYNNADNDADKKAAYQVMLTSAADLVRYPADAQPGLPSAGFGAAAKALGDDVALSAVAKPASEFKKKTAPGKNDKLKDANTIQKIDGWRALIFSRLVDVNSPWIDHAAVAALTGCRPAEVASVRIERIKNALVITIPGAKVSETKGQPVRRFTIAKDAGPEFAHLLERVKSGPVILSSDSTASAFSEALKRAGKQALGDKAPTMTGYIYRHALACDMKADGADRDSIAAALGHAVTKTQSHYGRATGGTKGARVFQIEAERPIKQTHGTGQHKGRDIAPTNAPEPAPVKVFTSPGFEL